MKRRIGVASVIIIVLAIIMIIVPRVIANGEQITGKQEDNIDIWNNKESDITEKKIEINKGENYILIGDDDYGDIPVDPIEGRNEGDYIEYTEPRYRIHPITGDVLDTETGEIIKTGKEE